MAVSTDRHMHEADTAVCIGNEFKGNKHGSFFLTVSHSSTVKPLALAPRKRPPKNSTVIESTDQQEWQNNANRNLRWQHVRNQSNEKHAKARHLVL